MPPEIIILVGAPDPSAVNTISGDGLLSDFTAPFSSFLNRPGTAPEASKPAIVGPSWRSLPLKKRPLETGTETGIGLSSQVHHSMIPIFPAIPMPQGQGHEFTPHDNFFTTASLSLEAAGLDQTSQENDHLASQAWTRTGQDVLSQFYDHSLARHHDIPSSQLPSQDPSSDSFTTDMDTTTSFLTTSRSFASDCTTSSGISLRPPLVLPGNNRPGTGAANSSTTHLSDLEDIPPASRLLALAPATVTVNLIAGIISLAAPRTVTTRWGRDMALVEVLLGDETRAGFGVTFWLPPQQTVSGDGNHHHPGYGRQPRPRAATEQTTNYSTTPSTLSTLRRQDVVLLQNVALHVFRGKVYGKSLRGGLTRVHLLYRRKLDADDEGGYYRLEDLRGSRTRARSREEASGETGSAAAAAARTHPQLEKTRNVWEWVLRFVGGGGATTGSSSSRGRRGVGSPDRVQGRVRDRPPDDTQD